jgi:hypothetical protein
MARLLPAIRKLCRYDRPKLDDDRLPVSFGWLDHRHHRIGFRRIGLPPVWGRRASFAAHVVVADVEALTEADLASTFGSPFWWDGLDAEEFEWAMDRDDFELPAIALAELLDRRLAPDESSIGPAMSLAHGLLTLPDGTRLAVVGEQDEFGAALRALAWHLPEALTGVSLSTYEGAATFPFRVFGGQRASTRALQCSLAGADDLEPESRRVLAHLLGSGEEQEQLRTAARAIAARAPDSGGSALWGAASRLVALAAGDGLEQEEAIGMLGDPDGAVYLAQSDAGRRALASALCAGAPGVRAAVGGTASRLPADALGALRAAIGQRYGAGAGLRGCAELVAALPVGVERDRMREEILGIALRDEGAAADLSDADAALLLETAALQGRLPSEVEVLLRASVPHIPRCAANAELPDAYLGRMFEIGLGESANASVLAGVLRERPGLLDVVELEEAEQEQCLSLLQMAAADVLEAALPSVLATMATTARKPRLEMLLGRLGTVVAGRCLLSAATREGVAPDPCLSDLCDGCAAALLERGERGLALRLLEASRSEDHPRAAQLLRRMLAGGGSADAVRRARAVKRDDLRAAIVSAGLDGAISEVVLPAATGAVWKLLDESEPDVDTERRLCRLLELARRCPRHVSAAAVLAWIALYLLPVRQKLLSRSGRLRDREADDLSREVAARLPLWCMEEMEPYLDSVDRRPKAWWEGLESHQRRLARRSSDRLLRRNR